MIRKIAEGIGRRLPVISLLDYFYNGEQEDVAKGKSRLTIVSKNAGHIAYAVLGFLGVTMYGGGVFATGEFNPLKQKEAFARSITQDVQEQMCYRDAFDAVFGDNGIADFDHNGRISKGEKVRAYELMGIEDKITVTVGEHPTLEQLRSLQTSRDSNYITSQPVTQPNFPNQKCKEVEKK
jgi:hypothetical protein